VTIFLKVTPALVGYVLESFYILLYSWGGKPQCVVVVEAIYLIKMTLTPL
jgi:hypothetical protein